jgi:Tfp pilus assembly protein PilX
MMNTKPGFTLLMSVLVASVLLALGYAIFNIAIKQVTLSSSGRESQFAFYAADSGIECGLYWDNKQDAFSTTSTITEILCGNATSTLTRNYDGTTLITSFAFSLGPSIVSQCADVVVTREDPKHTVIESYGYNTCNTNDPLRLDRAIRVTY